MHEETLRQIHGVETMVLENSNSIKHIINSLELQGKEVKWLNEKSKEFERKIEKLKKVNDKLSERCNDLDAYKRRWNLRVAGIPEKNRGECKAADDQLLQAGFPKHRCRAAHRSRHRALFGTQICCRKILLPHHSPVFITITTGQSLE